MALISLMEWHSFPINEYSKYPILLDENGWAIAPDNPGIGVEFDFDLVSPHLTKQS